MLGQSPAVERPPHRRRCRRSTGRPRPRCRRAAVGAADHFYEHDPGANWNRIGVYGYVSGARTEQWQPWYATFSGGVSRVSGEWIWTSGASPIKTRTQSP